jgi:flagellar basal body rod protein FlgG
MDESPIAAGSIESSNVNAVESMLDMVRIGRLFELSQKSIQSQDELLQRLISSLNE